MSLSRRNFLVSTAALSLVGCPGLKAAFPELNGLWQDDWRGHPFPVPQDEHVDPVSHVLRRLTFGAGPRDYARVSEMGLEAFLDEQFSPHRIDDHDCERRVRRYETLNKPVGELFEYKETVLERELSRNALLRAVYSRRQLHEVMVEFWTDHFNIDISKGECPWLKVADDRDVIRRHALGKFPALLHASALSPAMLWYLDGRANRKAQPDEQPNENYARELLELHTLGVHGGYTQRDVMEVARCLTGWTVRERGRFGLGRVEFVPEQHDNDAKVVLGHEIPAGLGGEDLERVLAIVSGHPSTAHHISEKLCRRFISDTPPPEAVADVERVFTATDGEIRECLRALIQTDAFTRSVGAKFKRPFRYVVSALRVAAARTDGTGPLDYLERMGHAPYRYPTPDGYPDEAAPWLGTLMWRWHFAAALAENRLAGTKAQWEVVEAVLQGREGLDAAALGRQTHSNEWTQLAQLDRTSAWALLLACPAFQRH